MMNAGNTTSVLILSDSHNNQFLLRKILRNEAKNVDYVFHLGDNYEDLDENMDLLKGKRLYKVPGIFHPRYADGTLPKTITVDIYKWKFFLVHNSDDIPLFVPQIDFFCYGHTHKQVFQKNENGSYYLNPGHLKDTVDRSYPASYAFLHMNSKQVNIHFKCCRGKVTQEHIVYKD
ncbi:MAG: metallophosphoesterase family protein, partial [Candidatus Cloacimonadia bacterium]